LFLVTNDRRELDLSTIEQREIACTEAGLSLEQSSKRITNLMEHGCDFDNRIIMLNSDIDKRAFGFIDAAMTEMEHRSRKTVTLRINSEGGEVYEALGIVGRLHRSKCKIITEGYGQIMSAATLVLACGDERRISRYCWFMHHEGSYDLQGRHSDVVNEVEQKKQEERMWAKYMEEFTDYSAAFWLEKGKSINYYLTARDLVDLGVVDKVI